MLRVIGSIEDSPSPKVACEPDIKLGHIVGGLFFGLPLGEAGSRREADWRLKRVMKPDRAGLTKYPASEARRGLTEHSP